MRYQLIFFAFILSLLGGCVGTGLDYSRANYQLNNSSGDQLYLLRKLGWLCSACVFPVYLNGTSIGQIGEKETLIGNLASGNNNLRIKPNSRLGGFMLGTLLQNSSFESIFHEKGENRFFIISLDSRSLKDTIMLVEVSEEVWRAKARR